MLWPAAAEFEAVLEEIPDSASAHYGLAQTWLELGNSFKAVEQIQAALELDPGVANYWLFLAEAYSEAGNDAEARDVLFGALHRHPGNVRIMTRLGFTLNRLRDYGQAQGVLERVLEVEPENRDAREAFAIATLLSGDENRALEELERLMPPSEAWNRIGDLYSGERRWPDAQRAFLVALQLDPQNAPARLSLSEADSHVPPPAVVFLRPFGEAVQMAAEKARDANPPPAPSLGAAVDLETEVRASLVRSPDGYAKLTGQLTPQSSWRWIVNRLLNFLNDFTIGERSKHAGGGASVRGDCSRGRDRSRESSGWGRNPGQGWSDWCERPCPTRAAVCG